MNQKLKHLTFERSFFGYDSMHREIMEGEGIQAYRESSRLKRMKQESDARYGSKLPEPKND